MFADCGFGRTSTSARCISGSRLTDARAQVPRTLDLDPGASLRARVRGISGHRCARLGSEVTRPEKKRGDHYPDFGIVASLRERILRGGAVSPRSRCSIELIFPLALVLAVLDGVNRAWEGTPPQLVSICRVFRLPSHRFSTRPPSGARGARAPRAGYDAGPNSRARCDRSRERAGPARVFSVPARSRCSIRISWNGVDMSGSEIRRRPAPLSRRANHGKVYPIPSFTAS